jgi:hypothetical protein
VKNWEQRRHISRSAVAYYTALTNRDEQVLSESVTTPNEAVWLECFHCKVPCRHTVIAAADVERIIGDEAGREHDVHQLVQCGGCRKVGYRQLISFYDMDGTESLLTLEELFPRRDDRTKKGRRSMEGLKNVPERPRSIYLETMRAFNSGQAVLAGVGIRAIVECVCKHKRVAGSDLRKKVDALGTAGFLSAAEVKLMHRLRYLGNRAAHEGNSPSREDLDAGLSITEHLLRAVYVAPKMGRGLPKKSRLK